MVTTRIVVLTAAMVADLVVALRASTNDRLIPGSSNHLVEKSS